MANKLVKRLMDPDYTATDQFISIVENLVIPNEEDSKFHEYFNFGAYKKDKNKMKTVLRKDCGSRKNHIREAVINA